MSSLYRFLSGEVPGGFLIFFLVVFAVSFIGFFLNRYSTVINKRKLKTVIISLLVFLTVSYAIIRSARPPKEIPIQIGIWPPAFIPRSSADSSHALHYALGWAIAEMSTHHSSLQSPAHVSFLRPEWMVESLDSADRFTFGRNTEYLLTWAKLIELEYVAGGQYQIKDNRYEGEISVYEVASGKALKTIGFATSLKPLLPELQTIAEELILCLFKESGLTFRYDNSNWALFGSPAIPEYMAGRFLLSMDRPDEALPRFQSALKKDSASALNWYGTGLVYGRLMLNTKAEKTRKDYEKRCEYHLKKAGHLDENFEPAYIALARCYLFVEPEPRYFEAEAALMAAQSLYDRDYDIYFLLSFMQKARWELFGFDSREALLKKSIETNPAAFHSRIELGKNLLEWAKPFDYRARMAMEQFYTARQLRPNNPSAIRGLVTGYDYIGQYDKALDLLKQYSHVYTDQSEFNYINGILHYHIAVRHRMKKKFKEEFESYAVAETYFKKAIQIQPNGYAFLYLGKIYDLQKRRNEAIEAYRGAMRYISREDKYREEARKKLREYFPDVE